jgi:hypothetical protein
MNQMMMQETMIHQKETKEMIRQMTVVMVMVEENNLTLRLSNWKRANYQ